MAKRLLLSAVLVLGTLAAGESCGAVLSDRAPSQGTMPDGTASAGDTSDSKEGREGFGNLMLQGMAAEGKKLLYRQFVPCMAFAVENGGAADGLLWEQVNCLFPLYGYLAGETGEKQQAGGTDMRTILLAEAEEEEDNTLRLDDLVQDAGYNEDNLSQKTTPEGNTLEELLRAENEAAIQQAPVSLFVPHTKQIQVDMEALRDYETLVRQFYTIDGNTTAGSGELNVDKFLEADMTLSKEGEGPQILIYHTHSQEGFIDSVPGEESDTIMGVGDRLTEILREVYGYRVLHHRGKYDVESRDDAYSNSLGDIERVLEENPSIEVVIDLHRDAVPEETRLVTELDGRSTARFMFFNGLSRTKNTGNIAYLYNENLDMNLALSFQMKLKAEEYYPGLTRRIYLKGYRYNMHLRPKCMLIELGAQNNTLEEALNACDPLAHILDLVFSGEEQPGG